MPPHETRTRSSTLEALFAEQGFAATSLRQRPSRRTSTWRRSTTSARRARQGRAAAAGGPDQRRAAPPPRGIGPHDRGVVRAFPGQRAPSAAPTRRRAACARLRGSSAGSPSGSQRSYDRSSPISSARSLPPSSRRCAPASNVDARHVARMHFTIGAMAHTQSSHMAQVSDGALVADDPEGCWSSSWRGDRRLHRGAGAR